MIRLLCYVWAGMLIGVSFLATPIKFRAESLTLPVALDVGRATFHAFGKVEWVLSVLLMVALGRAQSNPGLEALDWTLAVVILLTVGLQALWLIPRLDVRVAAIISGQTLAKSHLHTAFAALEFVKLVLVLAVGYWAGGRV